MQLAVSPLADEALIVVCLALQLSDAGGEGYESIRQDLQELRDEVQDVSQQVDNNLGHFDKILKGLDLAFLIFCSVVGFQLLLGLVSTCCNFRRVLLILSVWSFIISVLAWIIFGASFVSSTLVEDTCGAIDQYVDCRANNIASFSANATSEVLERCELDDILPCVPQDESAAVLLDARRLTYELVLEANERLRTLNAPLPQESRVPLLCNPFLGPLAVPPYGDRDPSTCDGRVQLRDAGNTYEEFKCDLNDPIICAAQGKPLTADLYAELKTLTKAALKVLAQFPSMESLLQCEYVVDGLDSLHDKHCSSGLQRSTDTMWLAWLLLAIGFTFLIVFWAAGYRRFGHSMVFHSQFIKS